jgi:hypothetical protein
MRIAAINAVKMPRIGKHGEMCPAGPSPEAGVIATYDQRGSMA